MRNRHSEGFKKIKLVGNNFVWPYCPFLLSLHFMGKIIYIHKGRALHIYLSSNIKRHAKIHLYLQFYRWKDVYLYSGTNGASSDWKSQVEGRNEHFLCLNIGRYSRFQSIGRICELYHDMRQRGLCNSLQNTPLQDTVTTPPPKRALVRSKCV